MAYQRITADDIRSYAGKLVVYGKPLKRLKKDGSFQYVKQMYRYIIQENKAVRVKEYREGNKKITLYCEKVEIENIFNRIKLVYDSNGVLIARKSGRDQSLRVTGKGMSKFLVKK